MAAGPIVITQIAGKMQKTSGNTILTPVLAAASSARWRRLVRSVSEWTRSDWATLENAPHQAAPARSEEHTSELQSPYELVCRLLLEKNNNLSSIGRIRPRSEPVVSACT